MTSLYEVLNEVITESGRDARKEFYSDLRLRDDLGFDSLELAVLTAKIEAVYGVDIFADGIVTTVGEIEAKLAGARASSDDQAERD